MRRTVALAVAGLLATTGGSALALTRADSHGHAHAVAEDKALLADAPTLPAAESSATSPAKQLDAAPQAPAEDNLVTRAKYWTVKEPWRQAYADLTATTPSGFTVAGSGHTGGPKQSDDELYRVYTPRQLPDDIADAALIVAVIPTGDATSAIGVYAQADPQPPRPPKEDVPTSVHRVVVSKVTSSHDKHPVQRTVTGRQARDLVSAFDALKVKPPGESSCAADMGQLKTATFRADGHTWTASIGACYETAVVRDGQALPGLATTARFFNDLTSSLARDHSKRPAAEHVPTSLRTVHLARRDKPAGAISHRKTVTGSSAATLVKDFDALTVEPANAVHCDIAGGPEEIVTFRTPAHTWVANESACTNVVVTRDDTQQPVLIGSPAWEKAVHRYLGG